MRFHFTAAVDRAIAGASGWSHCADRDEVSAEALLAGLLAEPECRAAAILSHAGVDLAAIARQWPTLKRESRETSHPPHCNEGAFTENAARNNLSNDVLCSLQAAADRLDFLPKPLELATEHILLGLASADHPVADWLRQRGLDPDAIEAEIRTRAGAEVASGEWQVTSEQNKRPAIAIAGVGAADNVNDDTTTLRVLDAAANRAREGLRVVEDYVRFVLDDQHLTRLCKQLRHDVAEALSHVSLDHLLASRETQADVGTALDTPSETFRGAPRDVLRANFARLQESLRSLEEFGKLVEVEAASRRFMPKVEAASRRFMPACGHNAIAETTRQDSASTSATRQDSASTSATRRDAASTLTTRRDAASTFSAAIKQLRYRVYTLERAVAIMETSNQRLASAGLYVLLDGRDSPEDFERLARAVVGAGVHVIQLRDKRLGDRELLARARMLRDLTRETPTLFIVNDRPDLAALAHADGVHVGQDEVSVKDARTIVGPDALIGVSAHNIEQARQAVLDGANYIGIGPTFASETKQFDHFPGLELLRAVAAEIRLPAFAIGGISPANVGEVRAAGFARIAVGAAVTSAVDPAQAARTLLARLEGIRD